MSALLTSLADIRQRIEKARVSSPIAAPAPLLLAASKGQDEGALRQAIAAGVTIFGENRVQEAAAKWPALRQAFPEVSLHLIGPLQTNKVKEALALFDVIQSVDRPKLVDEIARIRNSGFAVRAKAFYVQVNIGEEPQKAGVLPGEADALTAYCKKAGLPVAGLMCIPPSDQPPAPHFALLRKMALEHGLSQISMGMSEDFEIAVRMGSTCVRVGRALFGMRSYGNTEMQKT